MYFHKRNNPITDPLNDSLTNIQWLGGMQLKEDGKPQPLATQNKKDTAIQWRCLSHSEVLKVSVRASNQLLLSHQLNKCMH